MDDWYDAFEVAEVQRDAAERQRDRWVGIRSAVWRNGDLLSNEDCAAMDAAEAEADDAQRDWDELSYQFAMFRLARASGTGLK